MSDLKTGRKTYEKYSAMVAKKKESLDKAFEDCLFRLSFSNHANSYINELRESVKSGKPSDFYKKYEKELCKVFDRKDLPLFYAAVDKVNTRQMGDSAYRRAYRSSDYRYYDSKLQLICIDFLEYGVLPCDVIQMLRGDLPEDIKAGQDYSYSLARISPFVLAERIDAGDAEVKNCIREQVLNEGGAVDTAVIRACFMCSDPEMYELMGKLLLAARLQEGLRQAICENMDFGTKEAFLYMLGVIEENKLIRFSSVRRALAVCTGFSSETLTDISDRINEKHLMLIRQYLSDSKAADEAIGTSDHMKIWLAIWSKGFYEIRDIFPAVKDLVENGNREQRHTAAFLMVQTEAGNDIDRMCRELFEKRSDDYELHAILMPYFIRAIDFLFYQYINDSTNGRRGEYIKKRVFADYRDYCDSPEDAKAAYELLVRIADSLPKKKMEFPGLVFSWNKGTLSKADYMTRAVYFASASRDKTLTLAMARRLSEIDTYSRNNALRLLLTEPENKEEYELLTAAVADPETETRKTAVLMLKDELGKDRKDADPEIRSPKGKLPDFCYAMLKDMLRLKKADIRASVIELLITMDEADQPALIASLLGDKSEEKRLAGLDLLLRLKKAGSPVFDKAVGSAALIKEPTGKEQILIDQLLPAKESAAAEEESRPLFDPVAAVYEPVFDPEEIKDCQAVYKRVFPNAFPQKKGFLQTVFSKKGGKECRELEIFRKLGALIEANKDREYEAWSGGKALLGDYINMLDYGKKLLPYPELWEGFYEEEIGSSDLMLRLVILWKNRSDDDEGQWIVKGYTEYCAAFVKKIFGEEFEEYDLESIPYAHCFENIIDALSYKYCNAEDKVKLAKALSYYIATCDDPLLFHFKQDDISTKYWHNLLKKDDYVRTPIDNDVVEFILNELIDERTGFPYRYAMERKFDFDHYRDRDLVVRYNNMPTVFHSDLGTAEYISACARGIISRDMMVRYLFDEYNIAGKLKMLSEVAAFVRQQDNSAMIRGGWWRSYSREASIRSLLSRRGERRDDLDPANFDETDQKIMDMAMECYKILIPYVLDKELKRGDTPTEYSKSINNISVIYGVDYLIAILSAMGKDTLNRSRYLSYGCSDSKSDTLSYLLGVCIPAAEDGDVKEQAGLLKEKLKGKDITDKRLIEAALYSPEWISIVGEYLGWEGFEACCYYFMAHMNERFDNKRKALIARYSPLTDDEFNNGAFDKKWFEEVYAAIGEKRFEIIYDAAKYITDGARHSRARRFADAAIGKLDAARTREEIVKKRNKDLLLAYAVIPGEDKELRERYSYIRQFIKESRKFGAQRRASEKMAGEMAIKNMATAQDMDEMRFVLRMENEIASELMGYWEPHEVEDIRVCLECADDKAVLHIEKDGKVLKSVPAKLKKNEYITELQEAKATFTEQYRRTRLMFEEGMENETVYLYGEIEAMRRNPVLTAMIDSLVFACEGKFGLLKDLALKADSPLTIAHPYAMYKAGCWKELQDVIYTNAIVQPFKQVFRELYVKTEEESGAYDSRRYAGNQIQPTRTLALLKGRRWIADAGDGLQKIYYKENIIATIYALADWFSPADIEDPTLEYVSFMDRKTCKPIKIADVPDILFSEVMRDVDLVVSVAHAGEVDPEMSHSTVEMRRAIAEFTCRSFKLANVSFTDSHALVEGSRASYTIHLGSGVIHQKGGTMINVLPVHSQHRGRIFLPFVDDDPKTAEVISKILLFAEDKKIKDPFILDQLG